MKKTLWFAVFLTLFSGCFEPKTEIPEEVIGLAPVYGDLSENEIKLLDPQPMENLFKIYYKAPYIFAGELSKGIHIIDNTDPTQPEKIAFLKILGNSDIAIKGNLLYANNLSDLVTLDISNINDIKEVHRLEDAFGQLVIDGSFPIAYEGFFECVDPEKGLVIGWEERPLFNPQCWH